MALESDLDEEIWWELFDETHNRNYYYNTTTESTVWERPTTGRIVVPEIESEEEEEEEEPFDYDDGNTDDTAASSFPDEDTTLTENSTNLSGAEETMDPVRFAPIPSPISLRNTAMASIPPPILGTSAISPEIVDRLMHLDPGRQSCPPPRQVPLLEGWSEYYDKDTNSFFYLHESGQRVYDRDVACGLIPMVDIEISDDEATNLSETSSDIPREYPSIEKPRLSIDERDKAIEIPGTVIANETPYIGSAPVKPIEHPIEKDKPTVVASKSKSMETERPLEKDEKKKKQRTSKKDKSKSKDKIRTHRSQTVSSLQASRQPSLPHDLQEEINLFQLVGYAEKFFETHKRGIFRRQVPVKEMLCWTKETIPNSLTRLPSESAAKEAIKNFKAIQMYSGDRASKNDSVAVAQDIIGRAINMPELRDEIYCQLCKQSCYNPKKESNHKIWELFVLSSIYFPPSRDLEKWLLSYIGEHLKLEAIDGDEKLPVFARYVTKKLHIIIKAGPRGRLPTTREIERHRDAPFSNSVFGVTLEDVMELQAEQYPDLKIPRIITTLAEAVIRLNGVDVEGIFRVPGDTEQVYALRIQLDNGNYDVGVDDPNTPASLLKLWLRELEEPLVPVDLYEECIQSCMENENNTEGALDVLNRLPNVNKATALYVIKFLRKVADNQEVNKMSINNLAMVFAPNFLRCPSEDPQVIFNNTKYEQAWLRALMNGVEDQE